MINYYPSKLFDLFINSDFSHNNNLIMNMPQFKAFTYRYVAMPSIIGILFGIGHFIAYLLFSQEPFKKFEKRFNNFLEELL